MKNAFAVAALSIGLAFGSASVSFAGNVDGGAHPRSGVPNVAEQGAATARGQSRSGTTDSFTADTPVKQNHTLKNRKHKNKK